MNHNVSIIIPTMNRPVTLIKTITSLVQSLDSEDEIIMIDQTKDVIERNQSEKQLKKIINGCHYIYEFQNYPSSTAARNRGIELAKNEIIIFMDDDVEFEKDLISTVKKIISNQNIALIAGLDELTEDSNSKLGYLFAKKSYFKKEAGHVVKSVYGRYPNKANEILHTEWAMGYFFVTLKSFLNEHHIRFDETLKSYAYAEDLDFSYQYCKLANQLGYQTIIHPEVIVKHLCSKEYRIASFKSTCMKIINREYLSYKHFNSHQSRLLTRWSNVGDFLERLIKKEKPFDVLKAQYYCDRYRKEIKQGKLPYHVYEK